MKQTISVSNLANLDLQVGDVLEVLQISPDYGYILVMRQDRFGRNQPPDLGVSVQETIRTKDQPR